MNKHTQKKLAEYSKWATTSALYKSSLLKRLKQWFRDYKWPFIGFMWLVAFVLGYIGFSRYFLAIEESRPPVYIAYLPLQLFTPQSDLVSIIEWGLQLAHFLAPAMAVYTVIIALAIVLREQFQLFRLRFWNDHIVICGLGRKGLLLCEGFRKIGERVVVIEQDEGNGMLGQCRELGAIALIGSAADPWLLRRAKVHKARSIISVCGNDGVNAEVAVHARELVENRKGKALSCLIHIFDLQLSNLLREREIMMGKLDAFRLEFFNIFESGARIMLQEYPPFSETNEGHSSMSHIVVVGIGRMGESLVVNAARKWRDRDNISGERLRITLIDKEARGKKESLHLRYPHLERVCELVPVEMDIESFEFERAEFLFDDHGHCNVTMIYICIGNESNALIAALALHQRIKFLEIPEIPIVVRMTHNAGLATLLRGEKIKREKFISLHAFSLLDHTCTPDLIWGCTYEILARAIHEEYRQYMRRKGFTPETHPNVIPWDELPESIKESNRESAEHIRVKLEAIGCDIAITNDWDPQPFEFLPEEVELLAEMEHERWVMEKLRKGWKYGPTRNDEAKIHSCLVSWDQLISDERYKDEPDKDRDLVRHLPVFLAKARFRIYRSTKKE